MSDERAVRHCQHCNEDYLSESAGRCPGIAPVESEGLRDLLNSIRQDRDNLLTEIQRLNKVNAEWRLKVDALSAAPPSEPRASVGGEMMEGTIADHIRGCEVTLAEEQSKIAPDNALIALLCDSVRLARELTRAWDIAPSEPPTCGHEVDIATEIEAIAEGQWEPPTVGVYDEDARYNWPERAMNIRKKLRDIAIRLRRTR